MSEFRQNYATKEWVIIAPERALRPNDHAHVLQKSASPASHRNGCPFCPGNEEQTGRELLCRGDASSWRVRVVQNRYSALDSTRSVERTTRGLFLASDSYGAAEVVIETPEHDTTLGELSHDNVVDVLHAYRARARAIADMPNIAIVMVFRNHGVHGGTSLEHPHSQIIASPIIPPHIRDPFQKSALHYDSFGTCVYCDMVREEERQEERVIEANAQFVAFCPFASRSPYEIRIYPRRHVASYTWITDEEIEGLADILSSTLRRVSLLLGDPSYNFIIRSAPIGDEDVRYLHWYFVLIPRVSMPAGFEIGSGIYINPSSPEQCARELRETDPR